MRMPLLIVTGRIGACGNTKRTAASRSCELRHDRLEVVAVGAEAVQPDDGGRGPRARLDLDGVHV